MKKILQSKAGVTVLEGVIALGLLAVVTAGSFGVLLSASRQSSQTDMREDMIAAVEQANQLLQAYTAWHTSVSEDERMYFQFATISDTFLTTKGPCNKETNEGTVLSIGTHENALQCLLPLSCDRNHSEFSYTVARENDRKFYTPSTGGAEVQTYTIRYHISCNGYQL